MHESSMPEAMSSADLVKELTSNASLLIERQVKLAEMEVKADLQKGRKMVELYGTAVGFIYGGALMLCMASAMAIGSALDGRYWLGCLIVALCLFVIGAPIAMMGWKRRLTSPLQRTRSELSKEISWARSLTI